jgi:hypothetical protein
LLKTNPKERRGTAASLSYRHCASAHQATGTRDRSRAGAADVDTSGAREVFPALAVGAGVAQTIACRANGSCVHLPVERTAPMSSSDRFAFKVPQTIWNRYRSFLLRQARRLSFSRQHMALAQSVRCSGLACLVYGAGKQNWSIDGWEQSVLSNAPPDNAQRRRVSVAFHTSSETC